MTWFTTNEPLKDGWYWWRCANNDPEPEMLQVANKYVCDHRDGQCIDHKDFSGQWLGPITPEMVSSSIESNDWQSVAEELAEALMAYTSDAPEFEALQRFDALKARLKDKNAA